MVKRKVKISYKNKIFKTVNMFVNKTVQAFKVI